MEVSKRQYQEAHKKLWNDKTSVHLKSEFYDLESFKAGRNSLMDIELQHLGDLKGKKVLHLQCHFGQDTLSMARMGAEVTGVDLSDESIKQAKLLAKEMGLDARFIESDVLELDEVLNEQFDVVFTSYGTIGWLPDLEKWASLVNKFLKPGGFFLFAEFHPVVWMFSDDFSHIQYSYFNKEVIAETISGTYTDGGEELGGQVFWWNHSISSVVTLLLNEGLEIKNFEEFDYSPYPAFPDTVPAEKGFYIKGLEGKIPMVYLLKAIK